MILFLDFDGVLHPINRGGKEFSLLPHFVRVMESFPEVDIVISSAWRLDHDLDQLRAYFPQIISPRIIDVTPHLPYLEHHHVRHAEILTWLRDEGREYESWVAIDDDDWLFPPQCTRLILTDTAIGFDEKTERQLRKRLRRQINRDNA